MKKTLILFSTVLFTFLDAQFAHIDKLFDDASYQEALNACEVISTSNLENPDFLWRHTKAYFELSDQENNADKYTS